MRDRLRESRAPMLERAIIPVTDSMRQPIAFNAYSGQV
jgi:hypothetical protein